MNTEIMQRWMELVEYRITEGSDYGWNCFGPNAYCLDHCTDVSNGPSFSILFDRVDHTVYQLEAHDYVNTRSYRWMAPTYKSVYESEAAYRSVNSAQAYDNVKFIDLETVDDFFAKARAIYLGEPYDTRVEVPLNLPDDEMLKLFMMAHERDMTFNEFVAELIQAAVDSAQLSKKE